MSKRPERKRKVLRKTTFKERNHGLTRNEYIIAKAPIENLVNEYNLIQQKKSKLSKHLRDVVEMRIEFLIKEGKIKKPQTSTNETE